MAYEYKTKPYEHQRQALIKGAEKKDFAYFMEMGTGKTKVAIDNAAYLYTQNKVTAVLVIAPNSVYRNWANEIDIHCPVEHDVKIHKKNGFNYIGTIKNAGFKKNKWILFIVYFCRYDFKLFYNI